MDVDMEAMGARLEGSDSSDRVLQARSISEPSTAPCLLAVGVGNTVTKFGLLDAVMNELGTDAPVVITGDGASQVAALISHDAAIDEALTLRGLHHTRLRNRH